MSWFLCDGDYINTATIVRLPEDGKGSAVLHLTDGSKVNVDASIDEINLQTGAIVAASAAGFSALRLGDAITGKVYREVIAGWRVAGGGDPMWPVVSFAKAATVAP